MNSPEVQLQSLLSELTFWETHSITPQHQAEDETTAASTSSGGNRRRRRRIQEKEGLIAAAADGNSISGKKNEKQQRRRTSTTSSSSSTSSPPKTATRQELEAANPWQKAVDPSSGRTYYYDAVTRQTQWEKVRGLGFLGKE